MIEEITIQEYLDAWYKRNYSKYSEEKIQSIHCMYMDLSGLYESKRFQQLSYINYLTIRVSVMSTFVEVERQFAELFLEPFEEGFEIAERYHYKIDWKGDIDVFLNILDKIEKREKKYITELKQQKFLFEEEEKKQVHERKSLQDSRVDFVRNLNILGKTYRIDRQKTTLEEYALMVKDTLQEQKEYDATKFNTGRNRYSKT